jgi:hypothetical protein
MLRREVFLRSVLQLLVTASVVPTSRIIVTLMMEAMLSTEMSPLTRATRRHISEDDILPSLRREKSQILYIQFFLYVYLK